MLDTTLEIEAVHRVKPGSRAAIHCSSAVLMGAGVLSLASGAFVLSRIDQLAFLGLASAPMFVLGSAAVPLAVAIRHSQCWAAIAGTFCAFVLAILHISWFVAALSEETFFAGQMAATLGALVAALVVPWALEPILTQRRVQPLQIADEFKAHVVDSPVPHGAPAMLAYPMGNAA